MVQDPTRYTVTEMATLLPPLTMRTVCFSSQGIAPTDVINHLRAGNRLECPEECPQEV